MSDLLPLLESVSLSEHVDRFEDCGLEDLFEMSDDELQEYFAELRFPVLQRAKLRKAVREMRSAPRKSALEVFAANKGPSETFGNAPDLLTLELAPLVPLDKACEELTDLCPGVMSHVRQSMEWAKANRDEKAPFLTLDEVGAVVLFSQEFADKESSVYNKANAALRSNERAKLARPFAKFLRLLHNALAKLHGFEQQRLGGVRACTVWRGIKANLDSKFTQGEPAMFWGLASCTRSSEVLKNSTFLGKQGSRTLMRITTTKAVFVSHLSFFPDEDELLLPLGTKFVVAHKLDLGHGLLLVELVEDGLEDCDLKPQPASLAPAQQRELVERGFEQYVHYQTAAALATFEKCKDNCVALGYQAVLLWFGEGEVKKDVEAANRATRAALVGGLRDEAAKGNHHAQFIVGYFHRHGLWVVDKDPTEAAAFFAKAAKQGNALAQCGWGMCYQKGQGVGKNPGKAVKLYTKAADQGFAEAQHNLAHCYRHGRGVDKNPKKAVKLYAKAAYQGFAEAQNNLGFCYQNGEGVGVDTAKAVELYTKAADLGFAAAQFNLASCYHSGKGVDQNFKEAMRLYAKAAEQGVAVAYRNLGSFYEYGQGVDQDLEQARHYYRLAADMGSEEGKRALEQLQ